MILHLVVTVFAQCGKLSRIRTSVYVLLDYSFSIENLSRQILYLLLLKIGPFRFFSFSIYGHFHLLPCLL